MKVIAGTSNRHKIIEFGEILTPYGFNVIPVDAIGDCAEIEENGSTFEENAEIKALAVAKFAEEILGGEPFMTIADDSGLEVKALGGAPGIYSARYAPTNDGRIEKILAALSGIEDRRARFVCVAALADRSGIISVFRGEVNGKIGFEPRGSAGFGYDPVFFPDGYDMTFAELGLDVKNKISHRAKALSKIADFIKNKFGTQNEKK